MFNRFEEYDQMSTHSTWKTNLMLKQEQQRVHQRDQLFVKRTSFQQNFVNHYITQMKDVIKATGLTVEKDLPSNDSKFDDVKNSKTIAILEENCYLSEQEKWQITALILQNQQNFSIFMRLSTILQENKDQLAYLLAKIIAYTSQHVEKTSASKKTTVSQLMQTHRVQLMNQIVTSPLVQAINPVFFSNVNQQPLMHIINGLFHKILCLKQGIYEDLMDLGASMDQQTNPAAEEDQEPNFFA